MHPVLRPYILLILVGCLVVVACNASSEMTLTQPGKPVEASTQAGVHQTLKTQVRSRDEGVMVYVAAGEFPMGSGDAEMAVAKADCPRCPSDWFDGERPQHTLYLDAYWFDMYEVTNRQFAQFIQDGGYDKRELWTAEGWQWKTAEDHRQPRYWNDPDWNKADYPVVGVVWFEALAYCRWAGARLPSEAEWERAAGWDADRQLKTVYPWGNNWDPARANTVESALGSTTRVGRYCPAAASPTGACDLVGNVWEWVSSIYKAYPYRSDDGREDLEAHGTRALRGGSWLNERDRARVTYRLPPFPGDFILFDPTNGFRCAMSDQ